MPQDIEMLEPENEDWWSWGYYFGPEKWGNPELLEVSMTPVPRDITAQRQYTAALADVEERRAAALEMKARHISGWYKALGMEPPIFTNGDANAKTLAGAGVGAGGTA